MCKVRGEIGRVKKLSGTIHGNKGQRTIKTGAGRAFEQDVLNPGIISLVAEAKQKILATQNITAVHNLMVLMEKSEIKTLVKSLPEISVKSLKKWIIEVNTDLPGTTLPPIDHTKVSNPYENLYGKNWMKPLVKSTSMAT